MRKAESNHSVQEAGGPVLIEAAAEIGISLSQTQLEQFRLYEQELLFWNRRVNLISMKSPLDIPVKHFTDSLTLAEFVSDGSRLLDIGTGAGFPGMPLKILKPAISLTLVESNGRKVSFLKELARKLQVQAEILHSRVEDLGEQYRGVFDIVVSRAGLRLRELLEAGVFFKAPGGKILAMKGGDSREEEALPEGVINRLGIVLARTRELQLPITGDGRKIYIFQ